MYVLYEVNLTVENAARAQFKTWLEKHVAEMLSLPWFTAAHWYTNDETQAKTTEFVCHYYLKSKEDLDQYLKKDAARMRADGIEKFGSKFTASRRILIKA